MPKRENDPKIEKAKAICRKCPVKAECLQEALEHPIGGTEHNPIWVDGVWGGTTESERVIARILMGGKTYSEVRAAFQEDLGQTS